MNTDKNLDFIGINRRSSPANCIFLTFWASGLSCPALLCGRIVALFPKWPQERHAVRLHQPDLDPAVLAVAGQVLGGVAEDGLVAQLDSDLGRHVGSSDELRGLMPGGCTSLTWTVRYLPRRNSFLAE